MTNRTIKYNIKATLNLGTSNFLFLKLVNYNKIWMSPMSFTNHYLALLLLPKEALHHVSSICMVGWTTFGGNFGDVCVIAIVIF
jgi:hypothetical protein